MTTDIFRLVYSQCGPHSSVMTYHRVCNKTNAAGATSGAGTVYPSAAFEFTSGS